MITCWSLRGLLVLQKDEFLRLIINSIRNDLISRNESFQCLALGFVGNGALFMHPGVCHGVLLLGCDNARS